MRFEHASTMAHGKAIQSSFTLRERQRRKTDDRSETEEAEDADEA